jgi:beta-glucanase (GH16 family)
MPVLPSRPVATGLSAVLLLGLLAAVPVGAAAAAELPVVDDFEAPLPSGSTAEGVPLGFFAAQDPNSSVAFSRSTTPPAPVPGSQAGNAVLQMDYDVTSFGVVIHGFGDETATEWVTQDWSAFEGLQFELYGRGTGTALFVDVIDNRNPGSTTDDGERWSAAFTDDVEGWRTVQLPFADMTRKEIGNGAPNDGFDLNAVHGWAFGTLATGGPATYYLDDVEVYGVAPERPLTVSFSRADQQVVEGSTASVELRLSKPSSEPVSVRYRTTTGTAREGRDYVGVDDVATFAPDQTRLTVEVPTIDDGTYQGERGVVLELSEPTGGAALGRPPLTRVLVLDDETFDPSLVEDFETGAHQWDGANGVEVTTREIADDAPDARPGQDAFEQVLDARAARNGTASVSRDFAKAQDFSGSTTLELEYFGTGTGKPVTVGLENNRVKPQDADPSTWRIAWRDEFNSRAGTPPDPDTWTHEIGDGTIIGKPGWGNDELEYYTDSTENSATDGQGNLVITTRATDPETAPTCYYGTCAYTSARLVTQEKAEFAYGRIEARIQVPEGTGLWPAFWSLGTDINRNPWPAAGEIDIMEVVGRLPNEAFGTIHGPGYSGGQSFGNILTFDEPVADDFRTFAIEWSPENIEWFVDDVKYHEASPEDVAPNPWVFEKPYFLLLNVAVGGNFGGPVGADAVFPQEMKVDYVRVYEPVQRRTSYTASFVDDSVGWRTVSIPFEEFTDGRGNAPDLTAVEALTLTGPVRTGASLVADQVRLGCAADATVTTAADSGPGSLRSALASVCSGGTVTVAPELAGSTVALSSPLSIADDVTLDADDAPGFAVSGQGTVRVLEVASGADVVIEGLTVVDGYGFEVAGGVLNNGSLTLERGVVADNRVTTSGVDFWKGGGGIYNGQDATLVLRDSTVRDNAVEGGAGGGVYSFFGTTVTVDRSTISGNSAGDVGGGMRSLGDATLLNSTVSGNTSVGWHGGGVFQTDGAMTITHSTLTDNSSPGGTAGGVFVGTFGESAASVSLTGSVVAGNTGDQCFVAYFGPGAVALTSLGGNVLGDAGCGAGDDDTVAADAMLGPLADNGGPTATHTLLPGSPALDASAPGTAPAVDQRGAARPVGAGPDAGSVEAG